LEEQSFLSSIKRNQQAKKWVSLPSLPLKENFQNLIDQFSTTPSSQMFKIKETTIEYNGFKNKDAFTKKEPESIKKEEEKKEKEIKKELNPFPCYIVLQPIDPNAFIEKLPIILRTFIQDIVKIAKVTNQDIYQFSFAKLDLNISLKNEGDTLVIVISTKNKEIKALLKNQEAGLIQYLRESLSKNKIELKILLDKQSEKKKKEKSSYTTRIENEKNTSYRNFFNGFIR